MLLISRHEQFRSYFFPASIIFLAGQESLVDLLKFWSGWEVLSGELTLEVRSGQLTTAMTCFITLKNPGKLQGL